VARRGLFAIGIAVVGLMTVVPGAAARYAYVTNSGSGSVTVIETINDAPVATIPLGGEPVDVAISPDSSRAYVANRGSGSVAVIATMTNSVIASVPVGKEPTGIAASPDGDRVYVSNFGDGTVSAIDTATETTLGAPIAVGKEPEGVAVSPNGTRLFVAERGGNVAIVDTSSGMLVGSVPDSRGPSRLAIVPSGARGFVTDHAATSVTAFDPEGGSPLGPPLTTGLQPAGIAIAPNGDTAYVASPTEGTVTPVDTSLDQASAAPIGRFPGATGIAIRPDGLQGYVTDGLGSTVSILDTARGAAAGTIPVGSAPTAVAVMPDQGPRASLFISPSQRRAKKALTFHASGSKDPDGKIVDYVWSFGDGGHAEGPQPTRTHRYKRPGVYVVSLTVIDDEGCSTAFVYTGQTASCTGSAAAVASSSITVGDTAGPILRLGGPKRQALRGRVAVRARCPRELCSLRAHGVVVTSLEREGALSHRTRRLGPVQALRLTSDWRTLRLRVPGAARRLARRALLRGGEARAELTVIARDQEGELKLAKRKVELTLP
jgi:YVTN family beta-propeller protein